MQEQLNDMKSRISRMETVYYEDIKTIHSKLDEVILIDNKKKIADEARMTKLETRSGFISKLMFLGIIGIVVDAWEIIKAKMGS